MNRQSKLSVVHLPGLLDFNSPVDQMLTNSVKVDAGVPGKTFDRFHLRVEPHHIIDLFGSHLRGRRWNPPPHLWCSMLRFRSKAYVHKRFHSYAMFGMSLQEPHRTVSVPGAWAALGAPRVRWALRDPRVQWALRAARANYAGAAKRVR